MSADHVHPRGHEEGASSAGHKGHSHGIAANADRRYLVIALALFVGFMVVEVIVPSFPGRWLCSPTPGTCSPTPGRSQPPCGRSARRHARRGASGLDLRIQACGNPFRGRQWHHLAGISALVAVEAIHRLFDPPPVEGRPVLVVAILGVIVNLVAVWVLAKAKEGVRLFV
ncbi:UNVERIFIED_ORG: hypothetical protein ABIB13_003774 [Arthrobacter sp. UYEF2]